MEHYTEHYKAGDQMPNQPLMHNGYLYEFKANSFDTELIDIESVNQFYLSRKVFFDNPFEPQHSRDL
jgi:hypothetical protein